MADRNIPFVARCFDSLGQVEVVAGGDMTADVVRDADCLLVRSVTKVGADLLEGSSVRFVATATIGFEHIDVDYLRKRGIGFASAPGSNANSVAEYIMAALLSVCDKHRIQLEGKSIGIVGVGNVGSRVAKKCKALGMEVVLNDPPLERYKFRRGEREGRGDESNDAALERINEFVADMEFSSLEDVMGCDFVTLHTPLTFGGEDKTFHLADEKFFESLKAGCGFINTSRGGVHDTDALKQAIRRGRLGPVVLDVWENEPNIDCELLRIVDLSTPHIAGYSLDGKIAGMIMIYKAVCEFFGIEPKHEMTDFLPQPEVPRITVEHVGLDEQQVIREVVQQVYAINRDDFNTREIAMVDEQKRGGFFDDLRKNYPVRREFGNTTVTLTEPCPSLAARLRRIGFKVKGRE